MTTSAFRPTVHTQSDLEAVWLHLMSPLGFGGHTLWLMLIGADDRPVPHLSEIQDSVEPPLQHEAAGFADMLARLLEAEPGGRWAFLLSRPGRDGVGERDRRWARTLLRACRDAGVTTDVMHLANDVDLVPLPYDEVA